MLMKLLIKEQWKLRKRADAIKKYLAENGVDGSRISVNNLADTEPANTSESEIGKAKNRRVSFELMK